MGYSLANLDLEETKEYIESFIEVGKTLPLEDLRSSLDNMLSMRQEVRENVSYSEIELDLNRAIAYCEQLIRIDLEKRGFKQ